MAKASGDAGLSTAGALAAGAAVLAVVAGVLYATGVLGPQDQAEAVDPAETETAAVPAPEEAPSSEEVETAAVPAGDADAPEPESAAPAEETQAPAADDTAEAEAPAEDTPAETEEAADPAAETADAPSDSATETAQEESPAALTAPSFDVVRAAPDGSVVVAGRAMPGSIVTILLDGAPAEEVKIGASGDFVSFLDVTVSDAPRVLSLLARRDDEKTASDEEIILAPRPVAMAAEETGDAAAESSETATADASTADQASDDTQVAAADPEPATDATEADTAPTAGSDAPQQPAIAVLRSDSSGIELVQPAEPEPDRAPDQIVLDTIGYSPEGDVLLSGRSAAQSALRIYLNNSPVADTSADADGRWQSRLTDVAPGIYTLRLDALDAGGAVISRLETPFKRESAQTLAAATETPEPDTAPAAPPPLTQVTVQAGDTLWAISRERYGDGLLYVRVFEANSDAIRDPDLIYPGQVFTIPE